MSWLKDHQRKSRALMFTKAQTLLWPLVTCLGLHLTEWSRASSSTGSITWKPVSNAGCQALPQTPESESPFYQALQVTHLCIFNFEKHQLRPPCYSLVVHGKTSWSFLKCKSNHVTQCSKVGNGVPRWFSRRTVGNTLVSFKALPDLPLGQQASSRATRPLLSACRSHQGIPFGPPDVLCSFTWGCPSVFPFTSKFTSSGPLSYNPHTTAIQWKYNVSHAHNLRLFW